MPVSRNVQIRRRDMLCCFPIFRRNFRSTDNKKIVKLISDSTTGTSVGDEHSSQDHTEIIANPISRQASNVSDATEWFSAVSSLSYIQDLCDSKIPSNLPSNESPLTDAERTDGWQLLPELEKPLWTPCICQNPAHCLTFDPALPLFTPSGVIPGSYEEGLVLARACLGAWETILDRSDSLDPQMVHLGIGRIKRAVMNRLAVPLTARMEDDDHVLHCQIHTPLGPKSMHAHLEGKELFDEDSDCGKWSGVAKVVNFSSHLFCGGRPIRAIQLLRKNPKFGICFETRVVVPDQAEGKVMLFNLSLFPVEPEKKPILVTRVLKYKGPITK